MIKLDSVVKIIKFTDNSRYLISTDDLGHIYCYDIANNY